MAMLQEVREVLSHTDVPAEAQPVCSLLKEGKYSRGLKKQTFRYSSPQNLMARLANFLFTIRARAR